MSPVGSSNGEWSESAALSRAGFAAKRPFRSERDNS